MQIIARTKQKDTDIYYCTATIKKDIISSIPKENLSKIDKNFIGLLKLIEGKQLNIIFEDSSKLTARTGESKLLEYWDALDKESKNKYFYLDKNGNSLIFEEILKIFGDGKIGFDIQIEDSKSEIDEAVTKFIIGLQEQENRLLIRQKAEVIEDPFESI